MIEGLPCVCGTIKALGAFAEISTERRGVAMNSAIETGLALLLDSDLAGEGYGTDCEPSPLWQRFGFPLGHTSDLLEALEVTARLGVGREPQLTTAIETVRAKQDELGRWRLEYTPENTWGRFGQIGQPNKWVTLRALTTLRLCEEVEDENRYSV
jgi:hypothetical protein